MDKIDFVNQTILYLDGEIWVDCPNIVNGFDISQRYEVSSYGRVRNKEYTKTGKNKAGTFSYKVSKKVSRQTYSSDGYLVFNLSVKNGGGKRVKTSIGTHRLVAAAFIGFPKQDGLQVNHKNGVKDDNSIDNLEWLTCRENIIHSYRTGLACNKRSKHPRSLYEEKDILEIRQRFESGERIIDIAKTFNAKHSTISKIVHRKNYS